VNTLSKVLAAVLLVAATAGPAYPQRRELLQLQNDVIHLSQQITQLQSSVDEKNARLFTLVERVTDQVNSLAASFQKINDNVESVNGHTDKSVGELRVLITGMSDHINALSEGLAAVRSQLNGMSQQMTTMKTTTEPFASPEDLLRSANIDLLTGNYDLAVSELRDYLQKFPNDTRAPEAQLNVGEAFYNQKKYDQAIVEYDLLLQKYPNSDKTRTALYKKGLALIELNQPQNARAILQRVVTEYPNTVEATNAQQRLKNLQAGARGNR
jgi:tol-pal system protein YbgF